jgi:hypothetical protein
MLCGDKLHLQQITQRMHILRRSSAGSLVYLFEYMAVSRAEQLEPHAVSSHRRRDTLGLSCEVVRPGQHDKARLAIQLEIPSSEDVLGLDDVGDERQPEDQLEHVQKNQSQGLHRKSLTSRYTQAYQLSRQRAFPAGCMPGASDGSMPVGSARLFVQLF